MKCCEVKGVFLFKFFSRIFRFWNWAYAIIFVIIKDSIMSSTNTKH